MNLNRITLFVRVVETGSFAEAARLLDLPRSSVSRGVAALEKSLGVRLLQRTTRQLHLTEEGREYYQAVSRSLTGLDDAAAAVTHQQEVPSGQLRITASMDVGVYLLAPVTAALLARYPHIAIDTELTPRVVDIVAEGFDLALRVGKLSDSRLVARHLGLLHQGVFASREYLAAHGAPETVAALATHCCISFMGVRDWRLISPAGSSTVQINSAANSDNLQFSQALVADGIGVGLLPLYSVAEDKRLVRVLPDYATAGNSLQLVYPGARYLPKRVTLLRDAILDTLPDLLANQCEKLGKSARVGH